jgi:ketosteroid isomerase-like protein
MNTHPNAALVRAGYDAFAAGDLAILRELFAPDIAWHSSGRNWLVGTYRGIDAVLTFLGAVATYAEGTYRTEVHDILASEHRAVVLQRSTARRGDGRSLSVDAVVVFDIGDGKVTGVWASPWDLYEEDHFYGANAPPGFSVPPKTSLTGPHCWSEARRR